MTPPLTQSSSWRNLLQHRDVMRRKRLLDIALVEPDRLKSFELSLDGLRLNYALNAVTAETIALLMKLARERDVESWRERMFKGEKINETENRAVLHVALRRKETTPLLLDGHDVMQDVKAMRQKMARHVTAIRNGQWTGATGKPIRHIVNIGIGGSDLGPRLVTMALQSYASGPQAHFVANVDVADLLSKLKILDPAETLFLVVSKTFTTQETLLNARTARQWLVEHLGEQAVGKHFLAVSTNYEAMKAFGIDAENALPMWDWVGGRFSLWSAVGLSAAIAVGMDHFQQLLSGAAAMDEHFRSAPLEQNMPVMLAMLGVWNGTVMGARVQAVLPYNERLRDLPRYLQQLEMESNGKTATRGGGEVDCVTAPVLFGEPGTIGQHSFHQWLHQGSDAIMADFIGVAQDADHQPEHHRVLLANMVAQAGALAFGQTQTTARHELYPGNRPSNLIILDRLDPFHLGLLLALFEHKVFVQSVIWNINAFDQPGVELGKRLATKLLSGENPVDPAWNLLMNLYNQIAVYCKT